jgi:hypothetical protein
MVIKIERSGQKKRGLRVPSLLKRIPTSGAKIRQSAAEYKMSPPEEDSAPIPIEQWEVHEQGNQRLLNCVAFKTLATCQQFPGAGGTFALTFSHI